MNEPALRAIGVGHSHRDQTIFDEITLTVLPGASLALRGRSGSGKTTLLLILAGLLTPSRGRVTWPALDEADLVRRRQIGLVFQAPSLVPDLTAAENVALPLRFSGMSHGAAADEAARALDAVRLSDAADALPQQLSGGMAQRVAVARALAGRPRLLLADEPTGALDRDTARAVMETLREDCAERQATLIVATHDAELAAALPEQLALDGGRLTESSVR